MNVYDEAGQLKEVWEGVGTPLARREAAWTYNRNGQRTSLTDARGYRSEMAYDAFDRQRYWHFPKKNETGAADPDDYEEYRYDAAGNRTSLRKRDRSVLAFRYDALNRMTAKIVPERSGLAAIHTRDVYYLYDLRGLQTKARFDHLDGEGVTTYYDGFGRVASTSLVMGGAERWLSHLYDADGNRVRIEHPDNVRFGYGYDPLGRMNLVHDHGAATSLDDYIIRYWYAEAGPRYASVRGAGSSGFTTIAYHDPVQRPAAIINDLPFPGADMAIGLSYTPAGQIGRLERSNDAYAWKESAALSRDYAVNGQNQYGGTRSGGTATATFGYDANGNLASETTALYARAYAYDVENRLVSASGGGDAQLLYDPLGRLFQVGGPSGITRFLYDGDKLIAEYNGSGTLLRRYVHGPGTDEPVAVYEGSAVGLANRRYLLPDERGSIAALVNADGSPSRINSYDEYGLPGRDNAGRFQYTGQAWIPELRLYYYKARLYSPGLGRFLQVDPIGYEGGSNLYAYAADDPINRVDPTGLADLSYMGKYDSEYDRTLGRSFDMAGTTTVVAHGAPISQRRANGGWDRPTSGSIASAINAVSRTQRIFLGVCSMADSPEGRLQIAEISRLTGGRPIMASTGYIRWTGYSNGDTDLTAYHPRADGKPNTMLPAEFKVFNGSFADFGISVPAGFKVTGFNVRGGEVTGVIMTGGTTSSRISQTRLHKIRPSKPD